MQTISNNQGVGGSDNSQKLCMGKLSKGKYCVKQMLQYIYVLCMPDKLKKKIVIFFMYHLSLEKSRFLFRADGGGVDHLLLPL